MAPDVDLLAENLMAWGAMARKMPRSFEAGGVSYPVTSDQGFLGKLLPGRGFMSAFDLRSLGITRQPPAVYCPTRYRRIEDEVGRRLAVRMVTALGIQGAAIASYDGIIAARGGGKANDITFTKASVTGQTANAWCTTWGAAGQPGAGTYLATTAPTDRILTNATAGAISAFLANPSGTDRKYMLTFGYDCVNLTNMALLIDRLNDSGSYRMTVNTAETVAAPTNTTREYGSGTGIGNLMSLISGTLCTFAVGTLIVQYVNQASANTNAPTLTTAAAASPAGGIIPSYTAAITAGGGTFFVPLAAGDTGVRAIKQCTLSVNTGTGGPYQGVVFFPLAFVPGVAANAYIERDSTAQVDGLTELINVAGVLGHLELWMQPNGAATGVTTGFIRTCSG